MAKGSLCRLILWSLAGGVLSAQLYNGDSLSPVARDIVF